MGELLLELLSEEIPAGMQRRAIDDLVRLVRDKLAAAEIPAKSIRGYVTPRRLAIVAENLPARQPERREERRGPRVGAPPQALDGFLRGAGLSSIEQCEVRDTGRGEFYFAVIERPGRATADVLPEVLHASITELPWPKSMRFPAAPLRWVRPMTSVICLFDGEVLPLSLGEVGVGRTTRGHRCLSQGDIVIDNAADYLAKLEAAHVVLDQDRRRDRIRSELDRLANNEGLTVKADPTLLDEVTGLVEYPVALIGRIEEEFVRPVPEGLPPEVLATAMRTHQKYFTCLTADGSPAPRFLFVANNLTADGGKTIVAGNERVLRARLSDARFFWDHDRGIRLEDRVPALAQRVYYDKLGTMLDKTERLEILAGLLAEKLAPQFAANTPTLPSPASGGGGAHVPVPPIGQGSTQVPSLAGGGGLGRGHTAEELAQLARRAARLCKADLSTGMVGEFPELQGVMGRYYALQDGEAPEVADAIADHYKPLGPHDTCPTAPVSIILALADKLDALAAFFSIGEKPTGSRDPFALRRAALGTIRLVLENTPSPLRLPLLPAFAAALQPFGGATSTVSGELLAFLVERLQVRLRDQGLRHDLIAAAMARAGEREDDLARLRSRVETLTNFIGSEIGANLLTAYRRASNIVSIEQRKDQREYDGNFDPSLVRQPEERALIERLNEVGGIANSYVARDALEGAIGPLSRLRRPVDAFFEKVTVNVDEPALRENRLRLLSRIRDVMNQIADFSQIEG